MSKTEEAIAAIPSVREEAVNQAGVAEEKSPSSCARDLVAGVVVETASCIAREFIKGCAKHDPGSRTTDLFGFALRIIERTSIFGLSTTWFKK